MNNKLQADDWFLLGQLNNNNNSNKFYKLIKTITTELYSYMYLVKLQGSVLTHITGCE